MTNSLVVALRNGRVVISLLGRRQKEVASSNNVNDGNWHKVIVILSH